MQMLRFALVGLMATLTTYMILIAGVEIWGVEPVTASVAGYLGGMVVNYLLNYHFTFKSSQRHQIAAPRFLLVMFAGLIINAFLMHIAVNRLGLHYSLAQLGAIAVVVMWSYLANRLWSFAD